MANSPMKPPLGLRGSLLSETRSFVDKSWCLSKAVFSDFESEEEEEEEEMAEEEEDELLFSQLTQIPSSGKTIC